MIVAAAVCPAAPWLLPGVAPRLAERAAPIGRAYLAAAHRLVVADLIVIVVPARRRSVADRRPAPVASVPSAAPAGRRRGSATGAWAPRVTVTRSDRGAGPVRDLGPAVAAHLLGAAGVDRPRTLVEVDLATTETTPAVPPPAPRVTDRRAPVRLLVLADGAAAHGPPAPGRDDPRSAALNDALAAALAGGSPTALDAATAPDADPSPTDLLARVEGLRLPAGWTRGHPPDRSDPLARAAPFGIGHLVAVWEWDRTATATTAQGIPADRPDPSRRDPR